MRRNAGLVAALMLLGAGLQGQQAGRPQSQVPNGQSQPAKTQEPALDIYQIDLIPSGTGFALSKPVLEGDVYVFIVWPDRATVRLPKDRVKAITPRTQEMNQFVVYQIDLLPTGRMIAKENPTLKGTTYTFRTWRDGTLISMRKADIKAVTRLTGLAAFKVQQEERGAKLTANLPMQGGGTVQVINTAPEAAAAPAPAAPTGGTYWIYDGVPGLTTGFAPPNAVVSSPGDVPKAAEPPPHR